MHDWNALFGCVPGSTSCEFTLPRTTKHLSQQVRVQAAARNLRVAIQQTDKEVSVVFTVGNG